MELWRRKVHVTRVILCNAHVQRAFLIFDRLYIMTDVPYRDGKGVFLSILLALLCDVNNFVQEELFTLMIFILQGNLRQKSRNPLGGHLNITNIHWHYI